MATSILLSELVLEKYILKKERKKITSLGGLEPPTFRLTAERANRLRHRDRWANAWKMVINSRGKAVAPLERK